MPKIFEILNKAIDEGKSRGVLSQDIRTLIAFYEGYREPIDVLFHRDDEMRHVEEFNKGYAKLLEGMPVEYITNEAYFFDKKLYVDNRVLIPRRETSELVAKISELIGDYYDPRNYLVAADIGTGSGAIAIALQSMFKNWILFASDISKDALDVAKTNFERYAPHVQTLCGNSLEPYIKEGIKLDIIVSNPPYILNRDEVQDSVRDYEPESALYLDKGHSVYEEIFKDVYKVKKGSLLLCFEIGYDLKEYLTGLMEKYLQDPEYIFMEDLDERLRFLFVYLK